MMFDRFDICEAWFVWAVDWGQYAVITRLHRMGFKPRRSLDDGYVALEDNAKEIYDNLNSRSEADANWCERNREARECRRIGCIIHAE